MTGTLPKPKKIGSIKNGKVNYPKDQNFFHSSDIAGNVSCKYCSTISSNILYKMFANDKNR